MVVFSFRIIPFPFTDHIGEIYIIPAKIIDSDSHDPAVHTTSDVNDESIFYIDKLLPQPVIKHCRTHPHIVSQPF